MKMIKKLLPILCMCTALTACGSNEGSGERASHITLNDLVAANATETVLKGHRTKTVNTIFYNEEGSADVSTYRGISRGEEGYETTYEDSYGYAEYQRGNRMYAFDPSDNAFSIRLFIDHQMEAYIQDLEADDLGVWMDETIVENYVENGVGTMITEIPISGEEDCFTVSNFDLSKYDTIRSVYTYNPKTLELQKYSEIAHGEEDELVLTESFVTYSEDALEVPEFVEDLKNAKETRKVTLHRANGESNAYEIAKEATLQLSPPEGYVLYGDAEGNNPVSERDLEADNVDLYLLQQK